jgi:deoxyribonuclease V
MVTMRFKKHHAWNVSAGEAVEIQKRLYPLLNLKEFSGPINYVAGTDISFSKDSDLLWAGVTVFSYPDLVKIEERCVRDVTRFPYIPGLLSFREVPGIIKVLKQLKTEPDLILCDGQGIAHPRGLGLASHLGLFIDKPTIGCAKSRLVGQFSEVGNIKGDYVSLLIKGEVKGAVLRTRTGTKPLFISPGNRITLDHSLKVVMACCDKYRIPKPIRETHLLVNRRRREDRERMSRS